MTYLVDEEEADYQKIWFELQAMSWSHPEMRTRVGRVLSGVAAVLCLRFGKDCVSSASTRLRYPVEAVCARTDVQRGRDPGAMMGVDSGHQHLLSMISGCWSAAERSARKERRDEGSIPGREGFVECDDVKVGYEVFGSGVPTSLLLPTWTIIHSRFWKLQIPYLARHFRVVTFEVRATAVQIVRSIRPRTGPRGRPACARGDGRDRRRPRGDWSVVRRTRAGD